MPTVGQPERATQNRVIALFRDELRYRYLGDWTDRLGNSNIEGSLLSAWLTTRGYAPEQIAVALHKLRTEADNHGRTLFGNNQAVYSLLRYGVPVKTEAGQVTETVHLINWQEPERNDFAITESDEPPSIELKHSRMLLRVRPRTDEDKRQALVEAWYRQQLKEAVPPLLVRWQPLLNVRVGRFFVQRMKTRWGSCNQDTRSIRLNTDLTKKPRACLEYIVVHEMVHLIERTHNTRFVGLMDRAMPQWRFCREQLNRLPVRHEEWAY